MMRFSWILAVYLLAFPAVAIAEDGVGKADDPRRSQEIAAFSKDLARLMATLGRPPSAVAAAGGADVMTWAIEEANALREKWRDNRYVEIKGFTVMFPSGIAVDFQLK